MSEAASATTTAASKFVETQNFGDIVGAERKVLPPDLALPDDLGQARDPRPRNDEAKVEVAPELVAAHIVEHVCCSHGRTRDALTLRSLREAVERQADNVEAAEHHR
ncbi:MAG: hypothetical protein E6J90_37220 [Deltaproteobacteria bacterium]|nr:MAG: hypothetical protein E6J90_37220 [Deltaproteobacteria bacterium]